MYWVRFGAEKATGEKARGYVLFHSFHRIIHNRYVNSKYSEKLQNRRKRP